MSSSIVSPFPFFTDTTGAPLEGGYLYIGQSNLNPETAPVNVFWDAALTIPAPNPVRTVGGYPSRAGTASRFYAATDTYSITVRNRNHVLVFSAFNQSDAPSSVFDISTQVITATAGQLTFTLTTFTYLPGTDTLQVYRNGLRLTSVTDYIETNSSTVTLTSPAALGDQFLFQGGAVITGDQVPGSGVSFIQAGTGAVTRNIQDKARESVSVLDFGAVGNGAADDTDAIQAALNTGRVVYLPAGNYLISSALTITLNNTGIRGDGPGSIITTTSTTADVVLIGDGSTEISGLLFSNFVVWSSVVKSAGYAFNSRFVTDSKWENVSAGNQDLYASAGGHRLYYGWYFDRFDTVGLFGGWCVTPQDGIRMRGNANDSYSAELVVDGNMRFIRQNASGACGIRIAGNCGGIYLRRGDVSLAETGVIIDTSLSLAATTATKRNREIFIQGFNVDSCKKWGIKQVGESVAVLTMNNPWIASCGTDDDGSGGVIIGGGSTVIPIVSISGSPYIYNNVGPGVELDGGFVTIDGGQIILNGRSASGGHGIVFGVTLPPIFSVNGTDIAYNGNVTKGYGIQIPASLNNFNIVGATFHNNGQGSISNGSGFGPTKIIQNCIGYVTQNSGVATIPAGVSLYDVTHGMSMTPQVLELTPLGQPESANWNAGNTTSTQFTIFVGATTLAQRQFFWRASVVGQ
jgi:hypothetical protein